MSGSSITSSFQFISYKIDKIDFQLVPEFKNILDNKFSNNIQLSFSIGFRNLMKLKKENSTIYVGGITLLFSLLDNKKIEIAKGNIGIEGVFTSTNMKPELEESLAKNQIPAILFPYLRSSFTTIMAQSGFGSITLPLINIKAAAESANIKIETLKQ